MEKKALIKGSNGDVDVVTSYTGHERDAVLGLYCAQARMYSANDRRFTARDAVRGTLRKAVEGFHRMLRKFTNTRTNYPTNDAVKKSVYLSIQKIYNVPIISDTD